mgnify:CR=1 FL=1
MKNSRKIIFLGIQYIDYLVDPIKEKFNLNTSIPSNIQRQDGSIIGLSKSIEKYDPKLFKETLFIPIVGKDLLLENDFSENINPIIVKDFDTSSAILINDFEKGKACSFVDTALNYVENLPSLVSDKFCEIKTYLETIHLMYADNMKIDDIFIKELKKFGAISIDFCRSNATEVFDDTRLYYSLKKLIYNSKYIFLSDHEDKRYIDLVLRNKTDNSIFIFHKPEQIRLYFEKSEYVIENQFFDKTIKSEVGLGDLFSSLFLDQISKVNQLEINNLSGIILDIQKKMLHIISN